MRLRTFTATDMPAAIEMVRAALGDEAIIVSSVTRGKAVTVTAALEEERVQDSGFGIQAIKAARPSPNPAGEAWLEALASLLRYHGVPEVLAGRLVYKARQLKLGGAQAIVTLSEPLLARLLADCFRFAPLETNARIMLIGPPGIGKTLAIAKLAAELALGGHAPAVITTDNVRAGGMDQLAAFTNILSLPLLAAESAQELAAHLNATPRSGALLIDTAGCNPYDANECAALEILIRAGGFEPVLALPAGMDAHEAMDAARALAFPGVKRLIVTRADTSRRFGALLSAAEARGLAFAGISASARVVEPLSPFDADMLAQCLLKHRDNG